MAGASDHTAAYVDRYAADVGLAFQIIDDVLDVESDAQTLGKTAGKDAAAQKPSYPSLFGVSRSRMLAADCLKRSRDTLADAGLGAGWLGEIAQWVVNRKS